MYQSEKKRENFAQQIRSMQRRKQFAEKRNQLNMARARQIEEEILLAEEHLFEFCNKDPAEYERLMELANKYDKELKEYENYMCFLEEESVNFEKQQRQLQMQEILRELDQQLAIVEKEKKNQQS